MAAAWSLLHFYKENSLVRPLFREIDYSFRPALLAAYLAVVLPVCLNMVFRFHNCSKRALELSADRELFDQIAFNKQKLGKCREAERHRKKACPVSTDLPLEI